MAIPVEINAVAAPLDEASDDELFRVLQNALDFSVSACQFDNDQDGQLACEQYDKSILYIDEILGKLPSHTPQYSKLMQLRFSYDDRMEFLKNFDNMKLESTSTKMKGNDKKRVNQRSFEEDERLLNFNAGHSVLGSNLFEQQPALPSSVPFWRMRQIQRSISNGSFLSPNVFVPAGVWTQKGVKLCGLSIKSSAFQEVLAIIKEIDYPTAAYEHEAPTQSLLVLLSSLRIAYEEMAAIQNQLSKPFLFIQEIVQDDTTKPTSKGQVLSQSSCLLTITIIVNCSLHLYPILDSAHGHQVALSRFTSIVATFGKSVINFAEVGYQRLGTMATKISEEDFATYTTLLSHTCESCQVRDRYDLNPL